MNKEHTQQLFETAPIFYSGKNESIRFNLMSFGFECGDGWFYPLREFSQNVEALNVLLKRYGVYVKALQVKEKFGTLRVYFDVLVKLPLWKRIVNFLLWPFAKATHYKHFLGFDESKDQKVLCNALMNVVQNLVDDCEKTCMDYCEECGYQFGSWNKDKKVETTGWTRIVCKDCAEKNGWDYIEYGKSSENNI